MTEVTAGNGTLGKLLVDDELYRKANATVDKLNVIIDDLNAGKGTAGKFLKIQLSMTRPIRLLRTSSS